MADNILCTTRLLLRPVQMEDAPSIAALMTAEVSRWLTNFPLPYTVELAQRRLERIREAQILGTAYVVGIERKSDAVFMGWFGLYRTADERSVGGIGYWLGEPFQRNGYMSEAAPAALEMSSRQMRVASFEAYIHPQNGGSVKIVRQMGFELAGEKLVYASARGRRERCLRFVRAS